MGKDPRDRDRAREWVAEAARQAMKAVAAARVEARDPVRAKGVDPARVEVASGKGGQKMPRFNQTGPSDRGPMTGRGRGLCNSERLVYQAGTPGADSFGRGFRGGSDPGMRGCTGRRSARSRAVFQETYPENVHVALDRLKMQTESMKQTLDTISRRLSEMEKSE